MNRIVVITGASAGLGLSLAEKFLDSRDIVYGISRTRKNWLQAIKRLRKPRNFHLMQSDLRQEANAKRVISRIFRKTRRIDVLINSAGYANRPTRFEKESLAELRENISSNLVSTFLMCKAALPIFKKQNRGWMINVSSMAGKRAVPFLAAYSASKFGVMALTQSIMKENPQSQFKCITVCPGGMNTKMRAKLFGAQDAKRQQSPDFVANKIMEVIEGKIDVPSGGDIVIRHGTVTSINPPPPA